MRSSVSEDVPAELQQSPAAGLVPSLLSHDRPISFISFGKSPKNDRKGNDFTDTSCNFSKPSLYRPNDMCRKRIVYSIERDFPYGAIEYNPEKTQPVALGENVF